MTTSSADSDRQGARAAQQIWKYWQQGRRFDAFSKDLEPTTPVDGYAIQKAFAALQDSRLVGWKIAGTAEAGRKHINVPTPLAGRLFESMVHEDGSSIPFSGNHMAVAEAEIVLVLAKDIAPRKQAYDRDEIEDAVSTMRLGIEFPDSRFVDFTQVGLAGLIADDACARDFVLGPEISGGLSLSDAADLATIVEINGVECSRGRGADALGGPLPALVWLANALSDVGVGLTRGQFVTTGVTGVPVAVERGDEVRVSIPNHGRVVAHLV